MYILQEKNCSDWNDLYSHNDYNFLLSVKEVYVKKYPNRRYRVIEVIEDV